MAVYGRPQSVSLDLVLEARVRSYAERAEVTVSELIREAVGRYLDDVERRGVDAADDGS
jgi:predicted DNA-binding protein